MGKPLISDAAMRGMYRTMRYLRSAKSDPDIKANLSRADRSRMKVQQESLYAALLSQTHRRDVLLIEGNDPLMEIAMNAISSAGTPRSAMYTLPGGSGECAAYAAGMALYQIPARASATPRRVATALLRDFPAMPGVLRIIEERALPVLLVVQGEPESRADAHRRLSGTKVPVMPVDAADAVAVCRVMQECLLRARNGWGGAVLHALHLPDSGDPLMNLENHLQKRGLMPDAG